MTPRPLSDTPDPLEGEVHRLVEQAHRDHWSRILATTLRLTRDLDLAQECAQEAFLRALRTWRSEPPVEPAAWLTTVARRIALDAIRRAESLRHKLPLLVEPDTHDGADEQPTDVLRLMFICCHPALAPDARVALTLRLVGGLSTEEVAAGLLLPVATVAARITRAKKKIAGAGIPFRVPSDEELPERLDTLLTVLQVMSAAGHTSGSESLQRKDLLQRSVQAARLLVAALPEQDEARSLLAHLLLTRARGDSRTDGDGRLVLLADQDRARWDRTDVQEGLDQLTAVLRSATAAHRSAGRFTLQAVIAGLHMNAPSFEQTDWPELAKWYDALLRRWPTPVVRLNALVAHSHLPGVDRDRLLAELATLREEPLLRHYPYLPAAQAELLSRWGGGTAALEAWDRAIELSRNAVERRHLQERRRLLRSTISTSDGALSE